MKPQLMIYGGLLDTINSDWLRLFCQGDHYASNLYGLEGFKNYHESSIWKTLKD